MGERLYSKEHEYIDMEGDAGKVGLSHYAQEKLGDLVYFEFPEVGETFGAGEAFATVESVKATSDLYMPVGGEITELNLDLEDAPELANEDPYGKGWAAKIKPDNLDDLKELMSEEEYTEYIADDPEG